MPATPRTTQELKKFSHRHGGPYDLVFGSESVSPFDPPLQMTAHAASVVMLACLCQRKRREPQTICEVGVWQGQLSRWLLNCLPYCKLHLVDIWQHPGEESTWFKDGDRFAKSPQEQHDIHRELVENLCLQFAPRAVMHTMPSVEAAGLFSYGQLDLCFIDAAHDKASVCEDIRAWLPKVRKGGILCGHDYHVGGNYFGLIRGVEESCKELGLDFICLAGKVWAACVGQPMSAFIGPRSAWNPPKPAPKRRRTARSR
jgi:hypothetical protein